MKRRLWAPLVAVGLAALILVPTTLAVGEPGTTLFAHLGTNRFPGGQGAANASLTFNGERDIVLRIEILGPAGTNNAVRVYVDGTCTNPGEWVINRTANAGVNGPFITVASNSGVNTIQVNQLDVDRVRDELAGNPNETFALMVARLINGVNYRTCTSFTPTPNPPLTTTTTTSAPTTTSATTRRTTTVFSTGTTTQTLTSAGTATTATFPANTFTLTATSLSTGFTTTTSIGTATTVTLTVPVTTVSTGTTITTVTPPVTTTVPVTTISSESASVSGTNTTVISTIATTTATFVTTATSTFTATTATIPGSSTVTTVTNTFTVPVTTVTIVL